MCWEFYSILSNPHISYNFHYWWRLIYKNIGLFPNIIACIIVTCQFSNNVFFEQYRMQVNIEKYLLSEKYLLLAL